MIQIFGEDYIHRKPKEIPGFPQGFQNIFETYIENFVPYKNILGIIKIEFGMSRGDLDEFCEKCYNMNSRSAYDYLVMMADLIMRQCFKGLAESGNKTAMTYVGDYFTRWSQQQNNNNVKINITGVVSPTGKYEDDDE